MPQVEFSTLEPARALKREIGYRMAQMATNHGRFHTMPISLFGNVALPRARCSKCRRTAILIAGSESELVTSCCEVPARMPRKVKRECPAAYVRRRPPVPFQREQLALQDWACFWCLKTFGSRVTIRYRTRTLQPVWDHVIPFSLSQNNAPHNFVASCQVCNGWKSAMLFPTVEAGRDYLAQKWIGVERGDDDWPDQRKSPMESDE